LTDSLGAGTECNESSQASRMSTILSPCVNISCDKLSSLHGDAVLHLPLVEERQLGTDRPYLLAVNSKDVSNSSKKSRTSSFKVNSFSYFFSRSNASFCTQENKVAFLLGYSRAKNCSRPDSEFILN
jgi:hypothetical protein